MRDTNLTSMIFVYLFSPENQSEKSHRISSERKFDCIICESHFSKKRHLHEHYEQSHESKKQREEKILHCPNPKCNAKFHDRLLLTKHHH